MNTSSYTPSLKINAIWTLSGNIFYGFCQWTLLMMLGHTHGPELVGRYALAGAIIIPIFSLSNMNLRAVQATDAKQEYNFANYFGLRILTSIAALLIISGIATFWWERPEMFWLLLSFGVMKACESLNDLCYGSMQQGERMSWISLSMKGRGLFWLVDANAVIFFGGSLPLAMLIIAAGNLYLFCAHDLPKVITLQAEEDCPGGRALRPRFNRPVLHRLFILSLPIALTYMLVLLNVSIPRYFLAWHEGEAAVGIFAAYFSLTMPLSQSLIAIGQTSLPRLAKYFAELRFSSFWKLLLKIGGVGLTLGVFSCLVMFFFHRPLALLFYGDKFTDRSHLLFWIFLACLPSNFTGGFGYAITATRRWGKMLGGSILATILYAATCAFLIPKYELRGAIASLTACTAINFIIIFILLRQAVKAARAKGESDELP
ncbi:MAG: hypothetical protein JXA52_02850 [Planctomycetes bacterium]|nr:hypothetical protein [Planctomycetota bacterium]